MREKSKSVVQAPGTDTMAEGDMMTPLNRMLHLGKPLCKGDPPKEKGEP